ncbi:hypothetical protein ACWCPI_33130 [Streptomyces sp. NPDC001920]
MTRDAPPSEGELPPRRYAAPGWKPPVAPAPLTPVAINEPGVIRRRALAALAADRTQDTVVAEAGCLAGVLGAARAAPRCSRCPAASTPTG